MSDSIINRLFYGEISAWDCDRTNTPERVKLNKKIEKEKDLLKSGMPQDGRNRLDALENLYVQSTTLEEEECFAYGLRLGLLLMTEVLYHGDGVILKG